MTLFNKNTLLYLLYKSIISMLKVGTISYNLLFKDIIIRDRYSLIYASHEKMSSGNVANLIYN